MKERNRFIMSRKERTGLIALLTILTGLIVVWRVLPNLISPSKQNEEDELAWESYKEQNLVLLKQEKGLKSANERNSFSDKNKIASKLFFFDPNLASQEDLQILGLPVSTAKTLIKFRSKGGKFYKKEDLKKLYTLSDKDYDRIAPYVQIETQEKNTASKSNTYLSSRGTAQKIPDKVYLNRATADNLMQLKGIGPTYAKRILEYRKVLGGFLSVKQLKEIYGFPDSTYQNLKAYFIVEVEQINKININTATEEELAKHPYIQAPMAKNIILLRNDLKKFKEITQLRQVPLINEEKFRKIVPYLHID